MDPHSATERVAALSSIRRHMRQKAHHVLFGDWNFVTEAEDRLSLLTRSFRGPDRREKDAMTAIFNGEFGLSEWKHPAMTYAHSQCLSRLDRVYSTAPPSSQLPWALEVRAMGNVRLSDHKPVSFALKPSEAKPRRSRTGSGSSWM